MLKDGNEKKLLDLKKQNIYKKIKSNAFLQNRGST
jgi:hypothetical protein